MKKGFRVSNQTCAATPITGQEGSALVIVVIILSFVAGIGLISSQTTITELTLAGHDSRYKTAFFNTDSGIYGIPKVVSQAVNEKSTPFLNSGSDDIPETTDVLETASPFLYFDLGTDDANTGTRTFFREVSGFEDYDSDSDISFSNDGTHDTEVDVERIKAFIMYGGGAEFASGADGSGTTYKGIYFGIDSLGEGPMQAETNIAALYVKVIGAAGGL